MASNASTGADSPELTACDREPIHLSGAIQPHGLLLVADAASLRVVAGAGDLEGELSPDWLGAPLASLVGEAGVVLAETTPGPGGTVVAAPIAGLRRSFDLALHRTAQHLLVELEPAEAASTSAGLMIAQLDAVAAGFERASDLAQLCERAAAAFRSLTGFDRVMIYRFGDDGAGRVMGEDRDPALGTFMHHHFPATDIPRQARALYVRNRARAIPDIDYRPAPLRPAGFAGVDLSDVALRSVSPIHIQYLRNMGVAASASISIVKDGLLWGLVACHHNSPRQLSRDARAVAVALAGGLARQIRAKEEAEQYRERLRLHAAEDGIRPRLAVDAPLAAVVAPLAAQLRAMFAADGLAVVEGGGVACHGTCPPEDALPALARWASRRERGEPFATHHLGGGCRPAEAYAAQASGLLAMPLAGDAGVLLWFRIEQVEAIEWAGNPHKDTAHDPAAILTPRASFASWTEEVRGRSRRWTLEEVESARRLRRAFADAARTVELARLNAELKETLADKDELIAQKDVLMKEVDHRVQNSLQLVSSFLAMQARAAGDETVSRHLKDAQSRLQAVALVHRRLYHDEQVATVDLARYLDELVGDLKASLGAEWGSEMRCVVAPVLVPTDRAVSLGLIMTELVINATKYAYAGAPGPIDIALERHGGRLQLIVADRGAGIGATAAPKPDGRSGFGSRMLDAMVARLDGTLDRLDGEPGLRAVLTAPIEDPRGG